MPSAERLIILPVGDDTELRLLDTTLTDLYAHTSATAWLCVVATPSLWPELTPRLNRAWLDQHRLLTVSDSAPVWSLLSGELPGTPADADRLLLRPGVSVPPLWDLRLALAADQHADVGLLNPLCNNYPLLAVFSGTPPDDADEQVRRIAKGRLLQIPAAYSGCLWLAAAARYAMHAVDTGRAAALSLARHGWLTLACDHIYVHDHASRQAEVRAVSELADTALVADADPLAGLRYQLGYMKAMPNSDPLRRLPRQLHIAHSWGGGLDRWLRLYCQHDDQRENLVLRSIGTWGRFGQRLALYRSAALEMPLAYWQLDYPIQGLAVRHLEYRRIVREIIEHYGIEAILVSSLIGHSLDALDSGLPTRIIAHDYFPFCPAIMIYFGEICRTCERERLQRCMSDNPLNRFFGGMTADEWLAARAVFTRYVQHHPLLIIVPSPSVATHWQTLLPQIPTPKFITITHGLDYQPPRLPPPNQYQRLRVVVLGSLAPQKGRALLEALLPELTQYVDVYLLGCDEDGSYFGNRQGVTVIPSYTHDELADHMAAIHPHLGLLLSVGPETFSYTLSELWLMGVPVVATDLGSFADRITPGVDGWLCEPTPTGVLNTILSIDANREDLAVAWQHLQSFQHRSMAAMLAEYHALTPLPELSRQRLYGRETTVGDNPTHSKLDQALYVNPQARFSEVLSAFGRYTQDKLSGSPRLQPWQRKYLAGSLQGILWLTRKILRLARPIKY